MNTNFSDQNQVIGYPKYASSHNIDLSKIVTLSALVEPDSNLSKLKEKIERLKFQIAGQQQEIFLLKKSKLRFSNSVALNEEVQLVKKINSDLRAKVLELSKVTKEVETKLQASINETSQIEEKLRAVLQENIELKLQLHNNKTEDKNSKSSTIIEKDPVSLASEIRDLKKQVSLMRDHFEKSIISLTSNSRSNILNNNISAIPKLSMPKVMTDTTWTKSSQIHKSEIYEKLNNPIARPKKICGRLMNNHLNKELSKITSKGNIKSQNITSTSSKKSDDSSVKSEFSDETSESSSSTSNQSNQSNLSDNQSENLNQSNSSTHSNSNSTPITISVDNIIKNATKENNDISANIYNITDDKPDEILKKIQLINETKSELEEQIDEKLQQTTNLLMDIPCTSKVKKFEKISDNEN